jgi:hypothetical protein
MHHKSVSCSVSHFLSERKKKERGVSYKIDLPRRKMIQRNDQKAKEEGKQHETLCCSGLCRNEHISQIQIGKEFQHTTTP